MWWLPRRRARRYDAASVLVVLTLPWQLPAFAAPATDETALKASHGAVGLLTVEEYAVERVWGGAVR